MNSLVQSDIFFFITSISVVILTGLLAFVLVQLIKILKTIREISNEVKAESSNIIQDMNSLRSSFKEKSKIVSAVMTTGAAYTAVKKMTKKKIKK